MHDESDTTSSEDNGAAMGVLLSGGVAYTEVSMDSLRLSSHDVVSFVGERALSAVVAALNMAVRASDNLRNG